MKLRQDFVTNSSSSNYVIAYKSLSKFDEGTLKQYPVLKNLIERILLVSGQGTTSGVIFTTKEEYDKSFIQKYSSTNKNTILDILSNDEYLTEKYNRTIGCIKNGYYILDKDVDNEDSYFHGLAIELAKDSDNFIILEDE